MYGWWVLRNCRIFATWFTESEQVCDLDKLRPEIWSVCASACRRIAVMLFKKGGEELKFGNAGAWSSSTSPTKSVSTNFMRWLIIKYFGNHLVGRREKHQLTWQFVVPSRTGTLYLQRFYHLSICATLTDCSDCKKLWAPHGKHQSDDETHRPREKNLRGMPCLFWWQGYLRYRGESNEVDVVGTCVVTVSIGDALMPCTLLRGHCRIGGLRHSSLNQQSKHNRFHQHINAPFG